MAKPKFPKVLYVTIDNDGDEHFFIAEENEIEIVGEDGARVGVYQLSRESKLVKLTKLAD